MGGGRVKVKWRDGMECIESTPVHLSLDFDCDLDRDLDSASKRKPDRRRAAA